MWKPQELSTNKKASWNFLLNQTRIFYYSRFKPAHLQMTLIQFTMPVIEVILVVVPLLQAFKYVKLTKLMFWLLIGQSSSELSSANSSSAFSQKLFSAFKAATVSRQNKKYNSDIMYLGPAYLAGSILAFDGFKKSTLTHIYHLKRLKWVQKFEGYFITLQYHWVKV